VELALCKPGGLVPVAGPRVYAFADLVRVYLRARLKQRLLVPAWLPYVGSQRPSSATKRRKNLGRSGSERSSYRQHQQQYWDD
jgi:hypothetical protein